MNEFREGDGKTDWKTVLQAAALFWVILGTILGVYSNYLLGMVDDRINQHASNARDNRDTFYRDIQQRADGAASRIGADITELKSNCAVMQKWATGIDSSIAGLDLWRSNCSQKMAGVKQDVEHNTADISKLEAQIRNIERTEREEHRKRGE